MNRQLFQKTKRALDWLLPPCKVDSNLIDGGNALLRIVAIASVFCLHLSSYLKFWTSGNANVQSFLSVIGRCCFWAVPAFVILSGRLIPPKISDYKSFYKKRIHKILIPAIFWSVFYSLPEMLKHSSDKTEIIQNWLSCTPFFHLWFIFMLLGLYLLAPLCSYLIRYSFYFLIPFSIVIMIKPQIWDSAPWRYPILISIPYLALFLIGKEISRRFSAKAHHTTLLSTRPLCQVKNIGKIACCFALCYLLFMGFIFPSIKESLGEYPVFHYCGIFGMWGGISLTMAFLWLGTFLSPSKSLLCFRLSQLVLGVYLVHPLILTILIKVIPIRSIPCNAVSLVLFSVSALFACFLLVAIGRKIPFLRHVF